MNDRSEALFGKAHRAVKAAEVLLQKGDLDFAASRAYYAMFYAAEALLTSRGLRFRKHSGVHAAFGEHFIKTGLLGIQYHRWLLDAFDQRIVGDYEVEYSLNDNDVEQLIGEADKFVSAMQEFLKQSPS